MKAWLVLAMIIGAAAANAFAQEEVLVERGDAKLTLAELDGRMQRFPYQERPLFARKPENMARLMDQLLLNKQLAAEAKTMGLDRDPKVRMDMQLAMEEVLALHRLNELANPETMPDLEQLVREQYQANRSKYRILESREVSHVLISNEGRDAAEAKRMAEQIASQARAPGADFAELVESHSDDPGKVSNKGRYTVSKEGEYAPAFEAAARALKAPGDVSDPVETDFGYHVIRLESITPAREQTFEEVRLGLLAEAKREYYKRVRSDHTDALKRQTEQGNEALLRTLPARYGGRPEDAAADASAE